MSINYDNYWMKESRHGDYIVWRNRDEKGAFIYQATKGEQPNKNDGGYYNKGELLKLKGINRIQED